MLPKKEIKHILVWMPNWVGDAVFALPAVQILRKVYSHARITAVVKPPANEFLSYHYAFDSVIKIPFRKEDSSWSKISFAWSLRKYNFDLAVIFPNSFSSAWFAWLSGAKLRVGYKTESRGFLLTEPVSVSENSRTIHGVDYYLNLVTSEAVEDREREIQSFVTQEEKRSQGEFLGRLGIKEGDFVVAVQPGASKPPKRWHVDRFGVLCQKLVKEHQAKILLLGSKEENELLQKIKGYCPPSNSFVFKGLHLQVVAGLLKNCDLFVGNDSGLMHLAAAVGTPLVAIFGPGDPKTTDPCIETSKKEIVTRNYPCSPCKHRFFKECRPSPHMKPFCLEDISVNDVAEAIKQLMAKNLV